MMFEKQILKIYKSMAYTRCDDTGVAYYFSADDFPGLKCESYSFTASAGHNLQGYFYSYDNAQDNRIIVFDHGFGGGHRSYMKEIEILCRHGYCVFAYDHTGCMESGGINTNGMAQSLCDLNDCINALKSDGAFSGKDISVIGHSWGGFSTLNIVALHPEISHIVVLSGFVSVEMLVNSYFSGLLKGYRSAIMSLEQSSNPEFVGYNAVTTLSQTEAKVLLIYSDDDKRCHKAVHYDALASGLKGKENISFILERGKGHNPNYTVEAVKYLESYLADLTRLSKKGRLSTAEQKSAFVASFDWDRMTKQDERVWSEIFMALDS